MALDHDLIRADCAHLPDFDGGTAYSRTKICCRVLTERGEAIPSWMVIREIIVKGSSGDINRGIRDFRKDHAEVLRLMSGVVRGVPEHLAPHIRGFWEAAVAAVRADFEISTKQWQLQIEQADARAEQADQDLSDAQGGIQKLQGQLTTADATISGLSLQVETERAGRMQAERMFEANAADLNTQRERLEAALKESKAEMDRAFERFDGERRYAMMQIEEARAKAAQDVAAIREQAKREASALEMDIARLNNASTELRAKAMAADQRSAVAAQEAIDLRARLARAEATADKLTEDNRRMVTALKGRGVRSPAARPRIAKKIRSGGSRS